MTYGLRFLPEVQADVMDGYAWYGEKVRGLGEEFLRPNPFICNDLRRRPRGRIVLGTPRRALKLNSKPLD